MPRHFDESEANGMEQNGTANRIRIRKNLLLHFPGFYSVSYCDKQTNHTECVDLCSPEKRKAHSKTINLRFVCEISETRS